MRRYVKKISLFFSAIIMSILFFNYSYALTAISEPIYDGIDVSNWQGYISYDRVKSSGIDIVYIKASQGTTFKDPYMEYNYSQAKANGLKVGFYHFLTATNETEAQRQAEFFVSVIAGKEVDCKLAMDFEQFNGGITVAEIRRISNVFLETVKQLSGKEVIVYSNLSDAQNVFGQEIANRYPLWIAYYGSEQRLINSDSAWSRWSGWQYTSQGSIPGIQGYVDRNLFTNDILLGQSSLIPGNQEEMPDVNISSIQYVVKRGDTLSQIAMRYNTTVASLVNLNNISNPNLIYPGQVIYINRTSVESEQETNEMGCVVYTVKSGDNLSRIANRYGTTVQKIITCNKILNPNLIYPGQKIRIRVANEFTDDNYFQYVVKRGDTLSEIANRYGITVNQIVIDNNIQNKNLIYPGQVLNINRNVSINNTDISYVVKRGDTLWNISKRYGVSVESIVRINNIQNRNLIYPGQTLLIR